jgi:hypothetical protein
MHKQLYKAQRFQQEYLQEGILRTGKCKHNISKTSNAPYAIAITQQQELKISA